MKHATFHHFLHTPRPSRRAAAILAAGLILAVVFGPLVQPAVRAQNGLPTLAPTRTASPAPSGTPRPGATARAASSNATGSEQIGLAVAAATVTPTPYGWNPPIDELMRLMEAAWNAQNWPEVLHLIDRITAINPTYGNIQERRYFAYVNYGYQLMTAARCGDARWAFQQAQALRPSGEEAAMGLDLLARYCSSPTAGPSPTPTRTPVTPCPPTAVPGQSFVYVVQPGDTLYGLARRFGTTVQAIMTANAMPSTRLLAGQTLTIPAAPGVAPAPLVHVVQPGETLSSIARAYNTTVWAIMSANGLTSQTIWAYTSLYIPVGTSPGYSTHIVQRGETLYTIAQRYRTTVALLMLANNLRDYGIYEYQPLIIPPAGWTGWPPLGGSTPYRTHLVVPGDTLSSIARRYGVTVGALMTVNGLSSTAIYAGDTLRIP